MEEYYELLWTYLNFGLIHFVEQLCSIFSMILAFFSRQGWALRLTLRWWASLGQPHWQCLLAAQDFLNARTGGTGWVSPCHLTACHRVPFLHHLPLHRLHLASNREGRDGGVWCPAGETEGAGLVLTPTFSSFPAPCPLSRPFILPHHQPVQVQPRSSVTWH